MPELPDAKRRRFIDEFGLSEYDADVLTAGREMADYFEEAYKESGNAKLTANWVMGELSAAMNKDGLEIINSPVTALMLGILVKRIDDNTISGKIAKTVFESMWTGEGTVDEIIEAKGLQQVTDSSAIEKMVDDVINANPKQVDQYKRSPDDRKGKLIGFFVGQIMKASQGKANPQQVNSLLKEKLK